MKTRLILVLLTVTGLGVAQTPTIRDTNSVLNGASFNTPVAPGALLSIFGSNLASTLASSDTVPLSTSIAGVSVQFVQGSQTYVAPLQFIYQGDPTQNIPAQINAQLPWEITPDGPSVSVTVTANGATSAPATVPVGRFGPGVFSSNGLAIAVNNADGALAWAAGSVPGLTTHGAKAGDVVILYVTGLGPVDTPIADGTAPVYLDNLLRNTNDSPGVFVGGKQAQLVYSVLSPQFPGVYQLAFIVPSGAPVGDKVSLQIAIGGVVSPNNTTMSVVQ
ncbi:MAG: hypothetical protein LAP38_24420 [Acidobacteriia bacterium]|nr:hypothetical protein [Terriglobia bacterium]